MQHADLVVGEHGVEEAQVSHAAVKHPGGLAIGAPTHVDGVAQVYGRAPSNLPTDLIHSAQGS